MGICIGTLVAFGYVLSIITPGCVHVFVRSFVRPSVRAYV